MRVVFVLMMALVVIPHTAAEEPVIPEWRLLQVGVLTPGKWNAITDVAGVQVGHQTLIQGTRCRTGVTVIKPHAGNVFQNKVHAALHVANGFGKLAGATQVDELGTLETPIALTNTLSVPVAVQALIKDTLKQPGNENVRSVNAVVGETNDGFLNDIREGFVKESDVHAAIKNATSGRVLEGNVGAGTGTVCFGYKGGIGTASRVLPKSFGHATVGVLVQTNFGGILRINGAPVGESLGKHYLHDLLKRVHDGSCMIVVATDAPLDSRQLKRVARRALYGLVRTGGISTHGSGDYVLAFSTAPITHAADAKLTDRATAWPDEKLSPIFLAAAEATEEAIYHSLFAAENMTGHRGAIQALPQKKVFEILEHHRLLRLRSE